MSQLKSIIDDSRQTLMSLNKLMEEMFQFSNEYYLGIDIFIMVTQLLSILSNGFIIYLFLKASRLRRNSALRLILLLCITDFLFAWTSIPYMLHYVIFWNPVEFNYDGMTVITLSLPLTIQFKVNLVITAALALDRFQAMHYSFYYRQKNHNLFAIQTLLIGIILSLIDVYFEFKLDPLPVNKGCAGVGCFTSLEFRWYWGATNMALSFVLLFLTGLVARELKKMRKSKLSMNSEMMKADGNVAQANRLAMGIMVVGLIFQFIPSVLVGASDFFGLNAFQKIGPFYIVGLLLSGLCNSVLYITLHLELKMAAKRVFGLVQDDEVKTVTTTFSRSIVPHSSSLY